MHHYGPSWTENQHQIDQKLDNPDRSRSAVPDLSIDLVDLLDVFGIQTSPATA